MAMASVGLGKGIPCAIALGLAMGCAPRVGALSANEPDSFSREEMTVRYWVQKDDPSLPCPDENVDTDRCMLMTSDAIELRAPRLCCDEPRDPAPAATLCDALDRARGPVCSLAPTSHLTTASYRP